MFIHIPEAYAAPRRIVSLKPNITEILFALGAGDRVVGVTTYCDYPAEAKGRTRVADYIKPFTERIIDVAPDLVIGSEENSSRKAIHTLRSMGYEVALYPFATVDATLASIEAIGARIGARERGRRLRRSVERELSRFKTAGIRKTHHRVLVVWGHRPLVVSGPATFTGELLDVVGAVNVVPRGSIRYPHWSAENVIAANPEVIIDMTMGSEAAGSDMWQRLTAVDAVNNGRVHTLDDSLFRAGPRLPQALRELSSVLSDRGAQSADIPPLLRDGRNIRSAAPVAWQHDAPSQQR